MWLAVHLRENFFPAPFWDSQESAKVNRDNKKWKIPHPQFTGKLEPEPSASSTVCLVLPDRRPDSPVCWEEQQAAADTFMWLTPTQLHSNLASPPGLEDCFFSRGKARASLLEK